MEKWGNGVVEPWRTIQSCPINQCPEVIRQKMKAQAFSIFRDTRWHTSLVHLCLYLLFNSIIPPGANAPNLIFLSRSHALSLSIFWILELLFSYLFLKNSTQKSLFSFPWSGPSTPSVGPPCSPTRHVSKFVSLLHPLPSCGLSAQLNPAMPTHKITTYIFLK